MNDYFVHSSSVVDEGAKIGKGTKIWHFSHISAKAKIGENCNLGQNVFVADNVEIGNKVKIQNNVSLYEGVILEEGAFCGPSCVFTNVKTPRSLFPRNTSSDYAITRVKRGASIGANATIVCGVTLNEFCFIGAGSVITKDVPAYAVMAGIPAKQIGWMSQTGDRLAFDAEGIAKDSQGAVYRKSKDGVVVKDV